MRQPGKRIRAIPAASERVQRGERAIGREPEHRAMAVRATQQCRAIEIAIGSLHQAGAGTGAAVIVIDASEVSVPFVSI